MATARDTTQPEAARGRAREVDRVLKFLKGVVDLARKELKPRGRREERKVRLRESKISRSKVRSAAASHKDDCSGHVSMAVASAGRGISPPGTSLSPSNFTSLLSTITCTVLDDWEGPYHPILDK